MARFVQGTSFNDYWLQTASIDGFISATINPDHLKLDINQCSALKYKDKCDSECNGVMVAKAISIAVQ